MTTSPKFELRPECSASVKSTNLPDHRRRVHGTPARPLNPERVARRAERLLRREDFVGAHRLWDEALRRDPGDPGLWHEKGRVFQHEGKLPEALRCFDRSLQICPEGVPPLVHKGLACLTLERFEEAAKCYRRALELDPELLPAWNNLGNALHCLERDEEAIACYDRAIALCPDYALAWWSKNTALRHLGRNGEAEECLAKVCELDREFALRAVCHLATDTPLTESPRVTRKFLRAREEAREGNRTPLATSPP